MRRLGASRVFSRRDLPITFRRKFRARSEFRRAIRSSRDSASKGGEEGGEGETGEIFYFGRRTAEPVKLERASPRGRARTP